jgi:hypothetical protein
MNCYFVTPKKRNRKMPNMKEVLSVALGVALGQWLSNQINRMA